jgi:DNA-directed RNA polymerases I, II, and III subunit RPABC2
MENEDFVPSDIDDIEPIEDDDASIGSIKDSKKINDDDIDQTEDVEEEEEDDTDIESDDEYDNGNLEDDPDMISNEVTENNTNNRFMVDDEDDDDDDDDDDEGYLQKMNGFDKQDIIQQFHPELLNHNYDEVNSLAQVVRDSNGVVVDPLHKTLPFVTRYERARAIGERAKQINSGAVPFVEVDENVIDGYLIALKEFEEKKIPFIIKRPIPNGGCEYWKLSDLEILG